MTLLPWISHYGCRYVVHGDDITSDSSGADCYRFVKAAGRFKVVKRTPGISTTDLVGRMLLCTKEHFINSFRAVLEGREGDGSESERKARGEELRKRVRSYATDASGWKPWVDVYDVGPDTNNQLVCTPLFNGQKPRKHQRIVYVDGGFDLFSSGHIEFLRCVYRTEEARAREQGWYKEGARTVRLQDEGEDYDPCYIVVGIHDDAVINSIKGMNYPIMNLVERALCVLQCKVCCRHLHLSLVTETAWGTSNYH